MFPPGPDFARFLLGLDPGFKSFHGIDVLDPYSSPGTREIVTDFCRRFYSETTERILILGINPGRKGGGLTGIPFTDPVALEEICTIANPLKKERELSSTFVYDVVKRYGGPETFYRKVLLSAVCPVGFVRSGKNYNYYDDPSLEKKLMPFLEESFRFHSELGINKKTVISLGKENGERITRINDRTGIFEKVVVLEHPRFVMQYRRKSRQEFIEKYVDTISLLDC